MCLEYEGGFIQVFLRTVVKCHSLKYNIFNANMTVFEMSLLSKMAAERNDLPESDFDVVAKLLLRKSKVDYACFINLLVKMKMKNLYTVLSINENTHALEIDLDA